jgi:predicted dehydrogenase
VVATPPASHFGIARDCLRHNQHVLVAKPLTLNSQNAERLIETARRRKLVLMVGHTFEYNPAVRALKDLIVGGKLGKIHYVDAVRANLGQLQRDLDVLWDLAPHLISILLFLLGSEPSTVSALGADCMFRGKHDIAYLNLEFGDSILAHVRLSWLEPCQVRRVTVVGSRRMVVFDDVQSLEKVRIYDKAAQDQAPADAPDEQEDSYRHGNVVIPNIRFTEPLRLECQHFIDCVTSSAKPQSCGEVGLKVIQVLEAAQRSLYNGGTPEALEGRSVEYLPGQRIGRERVAA